eukprot:tig00000388_g24794.t1
MMTSGEAAAAPRPAPARPASLAGPKRGRSEAAARAPPRPARPASLAGPKRGRSEAAARAPPRPARPASPAGRAAGCGAGISWNAFLLSFLALLLLLIVEGSAVNSFGLFDVGLHWATLGGLYVSMLQLVLWRVEKSMSGNSTRVNWHALFAVSYACAWFIASYWVCLVLKAALGDETCNRPLRFNSVSGHYK